MGSGRAIYSYIAPRPRIWFVRGRRPRTNQIRGRGGYIAVYSPTRPHIYNIYPFLRATPHILSFWKGMTATCFRFLNHTFEFMLPCHTCGRTICYLPYYINLNKFLFTLKNLISNNFFSELWTNFIKNVSCGINTGNQ